MLDLYVYPFSTGNMKITGAFLCPVFDNYVQLHSHGINISFSSCHATMEDIS